MKNWSKFFAGLFALGLVTGCSNGDVSDLTGTDDRQGDAYLSVTVTLPSMGGGTRSATDDPNNGTSSSEDGTEIGKDAENKVNSMLLILARHSDNAFIACATVDNKHIKTTSSIKATASISKTTLANYYGSSFFSREVNVFVICNYSNELLDMLKAETLGSTGWIDAVCEVAQGNGVSEKNTSVWAPGNMLMSNAALAKKILPAQQKDWDAYSSESTPLDLSIFSTTSDGDPLDNTGSIRVERSVARFDFRDGSELGDNTYHVVATTLPDTDTKLDIVDIQLKRMALVNMSNKFYYFRRVTTADGSSGVGFPELPWSENAQGNYVEDVDFDTKAPGAAAYNFPLFDPATGSINESARNQWDAVLIDDVLKGEGDQYEGDGARSYNIWRYVTENTVDKTDRMTAGLSTGVVFKGKMMPTAAALASDKEDIRTLAKVLAYDTTDGSLGLNHDTNTDPILYTFGGNLYLRWPNIAKAAVEAATLPDGSISETNTFYQAVYGTGSHEEDGEKDVTSPDYLWHQWHDNGASNAEALHAFKQAATANGITLYQSSEDPDGGWGYYCYYFYWNRHNNNGNTGVMGDMEFAVVRNNVYKMAVTKINRLGHPRLSENDPDPVDPEDPDESSDVYISVAVEVVPWVVRVNDIEF